MASSTPTGEVDNAKLQQNNFLGSPLLHLNRRSRQLEIIPTYVTEDDIWYNYLLKTINCHTLSTSYKASPECNSVDLKSFQDGHIVQYISNDTYWQHLHNGAEI
jgi:hypothetical protein